jgi:hypothetical protein
MLSYALASLAPDNVNTFDDPTGTRTKGIGIFKFIKPREPNIIRELERYSTYANPDTVRKFGEILDNHNFNIKMLVAADYWFQGNDKPEVFTKDLFKSNNIPLINITTQSFESNKKKWDSDSYISLLTYANFLKKTLYNTTGETEVLAEDSEEDLFDYGGDEEGDD